MDRQLRWLRQRWEDGAVERAVALGVGRLVLAFLLLMLTVGHEELWPPLEPLPLRP